MKYDKAPLSLEEQAKLLMSRGLTCSDQPRMLRYLGQIGYYRLSAYCLPFESPALDGEGTRSHRFQPGTTFDDILRVYIFDRKLRLLVMEALERIEVSLRSRWANAMTLYHGSHAHMRPELFKSPWDHVKSLSRIASHVEESTEVFIAHYKGKYKDPFLPPLWAVVETMSFGQLSRWFAATKETEVKKAVIQNFNIPTIEILETVMHALTIIRNVCAHHCRLWNRRFSQRLPYIKRLGSQIIVEEIQHKNGNIQKQPSNYLYNYLVVMAYLMHQINPGSSWRDRLAAHVGTASQDHQAAMGFPGDWQTRQPWQQGAA